MHTMSQLRHFETIQDALDFALDEAFYSFDNEMALAIGPEYRHHDDEDRERLRNIVHDLSLLRATGAKPNEVKS